MKLSIRLFEHFLEGEGNRRMREVMMNWLKHFGVSLHKAHCLGHAAPSDIKKMVKRVWAETVVPIHTLNPEAFRDFAGDVRVVEQFGSLEF